MGNTKSLVTSTAALDEAYVKRLSERYRFKPSEIRTLHKYFAVIAGSVEDDGVIDMEEFQAALGFANSIFAERIFAALDEDESETLEFEEFCNGFYLLSPMSTKSEKVKFTFRIYDVNGDGCIDETELYMLLRDVIRSDAVSSVYFDDEHLRDWVSATYQSMCEPNVKEIRLQEYRKMVDRLPVVLQALTVPMNFLKDFEKSKFEKNYRERDAVKETVERAQSRRFSLVKKTDNEK